MIRCGIIICVVVRKWMGRRVRGHGVKSWDEKLIEEDREGQKLAPIEFLELEGRGTLQVITFVHI